MKIESNEAKFISRSTNAYLTPYAAFLVAMAAVSTGLNDLTIKALLIVIFTTIGNFIFVDLIRRHPAKLVLIRFSRIGFNYFFNICIVGLLWPIWPPIWMLLLLSICTVGIFEDRQTTVATASMFTVVLFVVQFVRGGGFTWSPTCELITRVVSLWTAGLLINRLTSGPSGSKTA